MVLGVMRLLADTYISVSVIRNDLRTRYQIVLPDDFGEVNNHRNKMYQFMIQVSCLVSCSLTWIERLLYEPHNGKTNKMARAPSEDSDQPGHPPSLIRVFAVRMKKAWVISYPLSA